jgi:hypothetical protein
MAEELAILPHGRFHPANGTAVNVRALDGHEKPPVKPRVTRLHRLITLVRIKYHAPTLYHAMKRCSPFSEVKFSPAGSRPTQRVHLDTAPAKAEALLERGSVTPSSLASQKAHEMVWSVLKTDRCCGSQSRAPGQCQDAPQNAAGLPVFIRLAA